MSEKIFIYPQKNGQMFRFSPAGNLILNYTTRAVKRTKNETLGFSTTENTSDTSEVVYSGLIKLEDLDGNQINSRTLKNLPPAGLKWLRELKAFQDVSDLFEIKFKSPMNVSSKDDKGNTVVSKPTDLENHTRFFAGLKADVSFDK